jgi:hypothetical protein
MGLPLLLLLAAASAGANQMAQKKTDKARSKVLREEQARRTAAQNRSAVLAADTAKTLAETADKEKQRQATRQEEAAAPAPPQATGAPTSPLSLNTTAGTDSVEIIADAIRRADEVKSRVGGMRRASEGLADFGNIMVENAPRVQRNAQDVAENITGVQNWTERVLPRQLEHANRAGRGWSTAGDLLQLVSMLYAPTALATQPANVAANAAAKAATAPSGIIGPLY